MKNNIIFDLDGTLLDSMYVWDNVGHDFLVAKGVNPPENLNDILETISLEETGQYFIDEFNIDMTVDEILEEIVEMVKEKYINEVELKDGVFEFLHKIKAEGKRMCILTASEASYVYPTLERLGIIDCFEKVYTCTELGMSKSNSYIYEYTAEKSGFDKTDTAVFEDVFHGIKNAKEAGFFVYAVYDYCEEKNIDKIKKIADVYVSSFKELL